jgi:hypothetical protein
MSWTSRVCLWSLFYFDYVKSDIREEKEWYKIQKPSLEKDFSREVFLLIPPTGKRRILQEIRGRAGVNF